MKKNPRKSIKKSPLKQNKKTTQDPNTKTNNFWKKTSPSKEKLTQKKAKENLRKARKSFVNLNDENIKLTHHNFFINFFTIDYNEL